MTSSDGHLPFRIQFELTRDENPRLYEDLIRFKKGTKRVNRLRFLAHEGLVAEHSTLARGGAIQSPRADAISGGSPSAARHTNQVFDPSPRSEG